MTKRYTSRQFTNCANISRRVSADLKSQHGDADTLEAQSWKFWLAQAELLEQAADDADRVQQLRQMLEKLKRGDCWCEVGIGNPMMQGRHSAVCIEVQALGSARD